MKDRSLQLKVVKADGTIEEYLHTKVLGTIANAFAGTGQDTTFVAEQLADAITFYLYGTHQADGQVSTSEIYFMIQAMLTATGHDEASLVLNNYHFTRALTRKRTEVVDSFLGENQQSWNKSQITFALVRQGIEMSSARTIAGMVEEKVLRMALNRVPKRLIAELVEVEKHNILQACSQLDAAQEMNTTPDKDVQGGQEEAKGFLAKAS